MAWPAWGVSKAASSPTDPGVQNGNRRWSNPASPISETFTIVSDRKIVDADNCFRSLSLSHTNQYHK
jgi:hypothetical protein